MELDLGAIAKGYIADRVRDYLRQQQVERLRIGKRFFQANGPFAKGMHVAAEVDQRLFHLLLTQALIGSLTVNGQSVVTSGTYERYFEQDGRRWHHKWPIRQGYARCRRG
jgi:thiamine biosynthesis lipoprotein